MAVLLLFPKEKGSGMDLHKLVKNVLSGHESKLCHSIRDLSHCLRQEIGHYRIAVLYLGTRRELSDIMPLSDYMEDMKLILVLPDGDPLTVSQAHRLRPRFITYIDNPFNNVGTVLKQMMHLYDDNRNADRQRDTAINKTRSRSLAKKEVLS